VKTGLPVPIQRDLLVTGETQGILRRLVKATVTGFAVFFFLGMRLNQWTGHQDQRFQIQALGQRRR
jgi:hypothetical protein